MAPATGPVGGGTPGCGSAPPSTASARVPLPLGPGPASHAARRRARRGRAARRRGTRARASRDGPLRGGAELHLWRCDVRGAEGQPHRTPAARPPRRRRPGRRLGERAAVYDAGGAAPRPHRAGGRGVEPVVRASTAARRSRSSALPCAAATRTRCASTATWSSTHVRGLAAGRDRPLRRAAAAAGGGDRRRPAAASGARSRWRSRVSLNGQQFVAPQAHFAHHLYVEPEPPTVIHPFLARGADGDHLRRRDGGRLRLPLRLFYSGTVKGEFERGARRAALHGARRAATGRTRRASPPPRPPPRLPTRT